ncbi:MAG: flagellar biosynthesis protein FlhF [Xanthomonadales bacterium]|nr:flagellar biosynthesis protein FlhF [Xanthomonadales bacterium]
MRIKRYQADNMRQALRLVREEQGADAVILSKHKTNDGIEVVAATDYDATLMGANGQGEQPALRDAAIRELELDAPSSSRAGWDAPDASVPALQQEMQGLRALLEDQLASLAWGDQLRRDPETAQILQRLAQLGFEPDIARRVAADASRLDNGGRPLARAFECLASSLPLAASSPLADGGIIALCGPTGVGKTTTLAKMAAHYALNFGRDQLALVTTDSFRIGAREQLATFARLLEVPLHVAEDGPTLHRVLENLRHKHLVLIDTAGISQRDERLTAHLETLNDKSLALQFYLTLSANAHPETLDEAIRAFGQVPLKGCVLTKLDEASRLGASLSAVMRQGLPLTWLTDGQRVPEDLHDAAGRGLWLVKRALDMANGKSNALDERLLAARYAEGACHAAA